MGKTAAIRIKEQREKFNLSQQQLAEIAGVSRSAVSRWESNNRDNPTSTPLSKMCEFFGVSMDYILGKTDIPDSNANVLLSIFNRLNEENKMRTVVFLKELEMKQDEAEKSERSRNLHKTKKRKMPMEENA